MAEETSQIPETKPYERQIDEKDHHYSWFHRYLMMGSARSLLGAYNLYRDTKGQNRTTIVPTSWRNVFANNRWKERAAAWDEEQRKKDEVEYEERRKKLADGCFEAREMALEKMQTMLRFPVVKTMNYNGTTTIEPAKWTFDTVPRLMSMIEDEDKTVYVKHEFDELSDDELIRRAAQLTASIAEAIAALAGGNGAARTDSADEL